MRESTLKALSVVALGVTCWAIGEEITDDFKENAPIPQKVFDIAAVVVTGFQGVFEVADLALLVTDLEEGLPIVPLVGSFVAIVGLALQLASLIYKAVVGSEPPPPSAQQKFFDNLVMPFLEKLPFPPPTYYGDNYSPLTTRYYQLAHINVDGNDEKFEYLQLSQTVGSRVNLTTSSSSFVSYADRSKQVWQFVAGTPASDGEVPYSVQSITNSYKLNDEGASLVETASYFLRNEGRGLFALVNTKTNRALTYSKGNVTFESYSFDNANQRWAFELSHDAFIPAFAPYVLNSKYMASSVRSISSKKKKKKENLHPLGFGGYQRRRFRSSR